MKPLTRRPWALPLVPLYRLGLMLKEAARPRAKPLQWPVISIGSISAGGAGKTPVVKLLAGLLQQHGHEVDVLSRGYGRGSGVVEAVDPAGQAHRFGDEPLELAQAGLKVYVGAQRYAAGQLAESAAEPRSQARDPGHPASQTRVHLLDDGFQHRRLARAVDIVLLTLEDLNDRLLPAGNLREPLNALRRADVILLRSEEEAVLRARLQRLQAQIWMVERRLELPRDLPARPLAFCGLARPDSFWTMLRQSRVQTAGEIAFPDHHPYTAEDVESMLDAAQHAGANGFITTAKDAVKLTPSLREKLKQAGPLHIAQLQLTLREPAEAMRYLRNAIEDRVSV